MKCRDIEPLLYLVREGEITAEEKELLEAHLSVCKNCKQIYDSAIMMTKIVRQGAYAGEVSESMDEHAEEIILSVHGKKRIPESANARYTYMVYLKGIAATLLIFIVSTLVYQEAFYYGHKSAMMIPLERAEKVSDFKSREADCLKMLKRKYKVRNFTFFPGDMDLVMNRISEEQLTQYIDQVCGSDVEDISKVKKMMIQAGLIKTNQVN
jgi:hypothetical protein